jgi:RimJ/RimL family protein N-acetyltransferase
VVARDLDILRTDRLALRRMTIDDLDWLAALYSDADVMRYLGGPKDRAYVETLMQERILQYYERHPGFGIWMTVDRPSGDALGFHLLNNIRGESLIQVGFILAKGAWGKGVGTEMASALLHYGFVDLSLPHIVGMTALDNMASQRVLLKIGLHRQGERAFPDPAYVAAGPQAWFERDGPDWLAERRHADPRRR